MTSPMLTEAAIEAAADELRMDKDEPYLGTDEARRSWALPLVTAFLAAQDRDALADVVRATLAAEFFERVEPAKRKPYTMDWCRDDAEGLGPLVVDALLGERAS